MRLKESLRTSIRTIAAAAMQPSTMAQRFSSLSELLQIQLFVHSYCYHHNTYIIRMEAALGILRKTPPADLEKVLAGIQALVGPEDVETVTALKQRLQLPFGIQNESVEGEKPFLKCPYNLIPGHDLYRSPWTNLCYPGRRPLQFSTAEEEEIRLMEMRANETWEAYRNLYYGYESTGSVYLSRIDQGICQGVFGIRKDCPNGSWNSAHLVRVETPNLHDCVYHVESQVVLALKTGAEEVEGNTIEISASIAKTTTQTLKFDKSFGVHASHIANLGTIIEEIEIDIRGALERVHIPRTQEVVDAIQKESTRKGGNQVNAMMLQSDAFKKRQQAAMQAEG